MPELPEVETIRIGLADSVLGKTISKVTIRNQRIVARTQPGRWSRKLKTQTIRRISRRGKFLLFTTDRFQLLVHLGMTGQLTYWDRDRIDDPIFFVDPLTGLQKARQHAVDKHTHLSLYFTDGNAMHYRDIRQFGKWRLYAIEEFKQAKEYWSLGIEPFTAQYSWPRFLAGLEGRKTCIKSLLLNQHFLAGLGNIYVDEALFEAGLHPLRSCESLTEEEKKKLFRSIPRVLKRGLRYGGTSFKNYINARGETGTNQERLRVYGRSGEACRRCCTAVSRIIGSQRGSHFCPQCQPWEPAIQIVAKGSAG